MIEYQRRSAISKYAIIGDSQIPSTLGQTITGALANIPFPFGIDDDGNYGYKKAGADSVTPFSSGLDLSTLYVYQNSWGQGASSGTVTVSLPDVSECAFLVASRIYYYSEWRTHAFQIFINRECVFKVLDNSTPATFQNYINPSTVQGGDVTFSSANQIQFTGMYYTNILSCIYA